MKHKNDLKIKIDKEPRKKRKYIKKNSNNCNFITYCNFCIK